MRSGIIAAGLLLALAGPAAAQNSFRPIDTTKFVINPANTTAEASAWSIRYIGKTIANTVENNAVVRTLNTLFSKRTPTATTQAGFSPYPLPTSYPSTSYQS